MKSSFISAFIAAGFAFNVALAQEEAPVAAAFPEALEQQNYATGTRPRSDADFYVYLSSASWCGPCRAIMPSVVAEYNSIKEAGGELIMVNVDKTVEDAAKYINSYGTAIPVVHTSATGAGDLGLPGYVPPRGIPHVIIVDSKGRKLHSGHGASLLTWRQYTCGASGCKKITTTRGCSPQQEKEEETGIQPGAGSTPATVGEALDGLSYMTETKPATDARFYIYLCSASWCGPCRAAMPGIVKAYADIKKAGGELLLLCYDSTERAGKAYVKKYGMTFPAVMTNWNDAGKLNLPGFSSPRGIPHAIFVKPDGSVIHKGHGSDVSQWDKVVPSSLLQE